MPTEKGPNKTIPAKSPNRKDHSFPIRKSKPATQPSRKPQVEPPHSWPRKS